MKDELNGVSKDFVTLCLEMYIFILKGRRQRRRKSKGNQKICYEKNVLKLTKLKTGSFFNKKKKKMLMSQNKDMKFFLRERKSSQCHNKDLMVIHTNKLIK